MQSGRQAPADEPLKFKYVDSMSDEDINVELSIVKESGLVILNHKNGRDKLLRGRVLRTKDVRDVNYHPKSGDPSTDSPIKVRKEDGTVRDEEQGFIQAIVQAAFGSSILPEWMKRLHGLGALVRSFKTLALDRFNPLMMSFVLMTIVAAKLMDVFTKGPKGHYDMTKTINEDALSIVQVLSIVLFVLLLCAGWWLGALRCGCLSREACFMGKVARFQWDVLTKRVRYFFMKLSKALIRLALMWCVILFLAATSKTWMNEVESCQRLLASEEIHDKEPQESAPSPDSKDTVSNADMVQWCYQDPEGTRICGVAGCMCSEWNELTCQKPPEPPSSDSEESEQPAVMIMRPLCGPEEAPECQKGIGLNHFYFALHIGSAFLAAALGLLELVLCVQKFRKSLGISVASKAPVNYLKVTVFLYNKYTPLIFVFDEGLGEETYKMLMAGQRLTSTSVI